MANLPTAYASQRFGNKVLDFYAAAGEVIGADPRARADERRMQDFDGARHTVRVTQAKFPLEPGDQASVLRLQPGPSRRSRPVAVVNHSRGGWTRTHPGANALLSRAGVARNVNWALTVTLFVLAALVCVWPYVVAFLAELAPGAFAGAPAFNVFALASTALPGLAAWSVADASAPLANLLTGMNPGLEGLAPIVAFGAASLLGAVLVFSSRSWRLLWAPLFVAALGAAALGFGGAEEALAPALSGLAIAAGVFIIGGAWNRITDAVRLESRIALLADHLLTNAPEEAVSHHQDAVEAQEAALEHEIEQAPEPQPAPQVRETSADALVDERTAVAVAASLRSIDEQDEQAGEAGAEPDVEAGVEPTTGTSSGPADADSVSEDETVEDAQADASDEALAEVQHGDADAAAAEAGQPESAEPDSAGTEPGEADTPSGKLLAAQAVETETGEAERDDTLVGAGIDADEDERLRTDPRYASRAILLPPPPPMPAPRRAPSNGQADTPTEGTRSEPGEPVLETAGAPATQTRTLNPGKPLPDNVVPIFAAAPPLQDS
ncbi:hypothetical protein ACWCOP_00265 [Maricaulaceae bacterium MS644]